MEVPEIVKKAANALGIKTAEQKATDEAMAKQRAERAKELALERFRRLGIIETPAESEPLHAATYSATTTEAEPYVPAGADEFSSLERRGSREAIPLTPEQALARDEKAKEIEEKTRLEREHNARLAGKLVDYFNAHKDEEYEPGMTFGKNLEKFAERLISENDPDLIAAAEALYPQYVRDQALFDAAIAEHIIKQGDQKDFSSFADKAMILTKIQKKPANNLN